MTTSTISIPGRVAGATARRAACDLQAFHSGLPADIEGHLARVLASPQFCRARRDGPLLRYLVFVSVGRGSRAISEYAIGIDVYRRDPATYSPADDPIVRVQMGRLRARLASYYREDGNRDPIQFEIPAGGYQVRVEYDPQCFILRNSSGGTSEQARGKHGVR